MEQRLSFVTLAVADLERTRAFYLDGLGWEAELDVPGEVVMVAMGERLVLSLWDDLSGGMGWLDGSTGSGEGGARGSCPAPPAASDPKASVTFSNIKIGDLGTTFSGTVSSSSSSSSSHSSTSSSSSSHSSSSTPPTGPTGTPVAQWGQCGGIGYTGSTTCASPYTCHVLNPCEYSTFNFAIRYTHIAL